jgi:hypothetical protein
MNGGNLQGLPMQGNSNPQQQIAQLSPQDIAAMQDATGSKLTKQTTTTAQLNQGTYENSAQNLLDNVLQQAPSIVQYAGLAGKTRGAAQRALTAADFPTPQAYAQYHMFTTQTAPLLGNEIRRALGAQATDREQSLISKVVNPVTWDSNPTLAMQSLQNLQSILQANRKALSLSPFQQRQQMIQQVGAPAQQQGQSAQNSVQNGEIMIQTPDGRTIAIPKNNLQQAIKLGARQIQ